jgi:hypothetical protein
MAACAIVGAAFLGACRGENLFSLAASVAQPGPQVNMTQPGPGYTIAPGDSIRILAEVNAQAGLSGVAYRGSYVADDSDAYTPETQSFAGVPFARLDNRLRAVAGQVAGDVYIVVEATDLTGAVGKDSVKVQIIN